MNERTMSRPALPAEMMSYPTVFAVEDQYQIFVPFSAEVMMWVTVGDKTYYDDCNGILRSGTRVHWVELPMKELDAAGEYTVVFKRIIERKPYYPETKPACSLTIAFHPVPTEGEIRLYHIADAHDLVTEPIAAGSYFGEVLHLLVLNGDLIGHSGEIENFFGIFAIASGITGGSIPVVFARGNHDNRGIHAEDLPHYTPTAGGRTYYTFRVGSVWGLVLDGGEDKADDSPEYGGTVCFHPFRRRETDFIRKVIANADREYEAEGVRHRLVISHMPFTHVQKPPFNIEKEIYSEWSALLREHIKPDLLLYGHIHALKILPIGADWDDLGQPCTAIVGAKPYFAKRDHVPHDRFAGCAVTLRPDGRMRVVFNDSDGTILGDEIVD